MSAETPLLVVVITCPANASPAMTEGLRLATAAVANARPVRLCLAGLKSCSDFAADALSPAGERYLEAMASFDVTPQPCDAHQLGELAAGAQGVVVIGAPDRPGAPRLYTWRRGEAPDLAALAGAAAVVLDSLAGAASHS